ncbi:MAG: NADH-quinone oxidoreductase subunit A [Ardenticatenaceae bacterium]
MNFAPYITIGILLIFSTGLALIVVLLGAILGPKNPTTRKLKPYESGMVPVGEAMQRMPIRFYLIATLFIVFDIEVMFLVPYALIVRDLGTYGLVLVITFLLIVFLIGDLYVWQKGALEWD